MGRKTLPVGQIRVSQQVRLTQRTQNALTEEATELAIARAKLAEQIIVEHYERRARRLKRAAK